MLIGSSWEQLLRAAEHAGGPRDPEKAEQGPQPQGAWAFSVKEASVIY